MSVLKYDDRNCVSVPLNTPRLLKQPASDALDVPPWLETPHTMKLGLAEGSSSQQMSGSLECPSHYRRLIRESVGTVDNMGAVYGSLACMRYDRVS